MPRLHHFALVTALLAFAAPIAPGAARADGFDQFLIFGDSTLDTGYFRYHTSGNHQFDVGLREAINKGATGGWAGNGVMNTTILADKFGLSAAPIDQFTDPAGNYANGGATTMNNNGAAVQDNICTVQQIQNYLHSVHGVANPDALYLIKTGDNDATWVTSMGQTWRNAHPTYLGEVASHIAVEVAGLQEAGARNIVVRNSYDSALFAGPGGDIPLANAGAYERSHELGAAEWWDLTTRGVRFIAADNDSLFKYIAHNPTAFGFTTKTVQASEARYANPHVSACFDILSPADQRDYLFIDGIHLTTAGQTIEADYTYNLLVAPSEISLLGESAIQSGWAHAATIQGQIDPLGQHRGPCGVNGWVSSGAYHMNVNSPQGFAEDSGAPYGGTFGVDYETPSGLIVGAAFTAGTQRQGFSTGGHFDQTDEAPSIYFAYLDGPVWGNAIVTYDAFQDKIARSVPLGILTDYNSGHTCGQNVAVALRGGWNLSMGRIITGPVAGVVLQRAHINDFTETGDTGLTALSFGSQTRDSSVTQLGWRVSTEVGAFQPFGEMNWNHECAGRNRMITTTLTTAWAPAYTMDAVPEASDWATMSLGAYYKLSPRVILRGAASSMFINPQMTTCGGDLGINVCF